jgi:DNA transformation protein
MRNIQAIKKQEISEFAHYMLDMAQSIGPVRLKRMFGGQGLFLNNLMIALIMDDVLYLKTDKSKLNDFKQQGLLPFTYVRKGKICTLSFHQAPEETMEDSDALQYWLNEAYCVALRVKRN